MNQLHLHHGVFDQICAAIRLIMVSRSFGVDPVFCKRSCHWASVIIILRIFNRDGESEAFVESTNRIDSNTSFAPHWQPRSAVQTDQVVCETAGGIWPRSLQYEMTREIKPFWLTFSLKTSIASVWWVRFLFLFVMQGDGCKHSRMGGFRSSVAPDQSRRRGRRQANRRCPRKRNQ